MFEAKLADGSILKKIVEAIKSVGGSYPKFLINTHYHGDHTGGNEKLAFQYPGSLSGDSSSRKSASTGAFNLRPSAMANSLAVWASLPSWIGTTMRLTLRDSPGRYRITGQGETGITFSAIVPSLAPPSAGRRASKSNISARSSRGDLPAR